MNLKITTAAAALALLAFPVGAGAKPGSGHGPGNVPTTQNDGGRSAAGTAAPDAATAPTPRRGRRPQSVGFAVTGSPASFTPETVTLDVKRANRHARAYIATAGSTFELGSARVKFAGITDADGSGEVDFADVQPTDRVIAVGKASRPKRGCEGEATLKLRKVHFVRPDVEQDEAGDEA